jgi:hypothetical protein
MPNDPQKTGAPGFPDPAAHNADVAAKLAAQDISGQSTATANLSDTGAALDALASQVVQPAAGDTPPAPKAGDTPPGDTPPAPKAGDTPPGDTPPASKAGDTPPGDTPPAPDPFKDVPGLPPGARAKSAEAFEAIKARALEEITRRDQQIAEFQAKLKEAEEKAKAPSPEALAKEQELESLRQWRAKLDVDFDPQFKEFDKKVEDIREFIYAQLKQSPAVTDEIIAKIKSYGGPDKIQLAKLFTAINDPAIQSLVTSKVADIAMLQYQKDQAVKGAKENLGQYLNERQQAAQQFATQHTTATNTELTNLLGALDWAKDKTPGEKATDAEKAEAADHNKFVAKVREQLNAALQDDSPRMRAIQLVGMAQLFNLQRTHEATKAKLATVEKQLSEVTAKWEKVRNASVTRLERSGASTGAVAAPKPVNQFTTSAAEALDGIARQVMEERAAKGQ